MNEQVIANHVLGMPGDGALSCLSCHFGISTWAMDAMAPSHGHAAWQAVRGEAASPEGPPTPPSEGERSHIGTGSAAEGACFGPETFSAQRGVGGGV